MRFRKLRRTGRFVLLICAASFVVFLAVSEAFHRFCSDIGELLVKIWNR